jgi:hypothetical protein
MIIHNFLFSDKGVCTHTRGDTAKFMIEVQEDGAVVPYWEATFSVKQYPDDDSYLFQIHFNQDTPCIIPHSITQNFHRCPHNHHCDQKTNVTFQTNMPNEANQCPS